MTKNKKKMRRWLRRRRQASINRARRCFDLLLLAWTSDDPTVTENIRREYRRQCELRWSYRAIHNARGNWSHFEELKPQLLEALRAFQKDPLQVDLSGKSHNPDGTLTSFLWSLQTALQPDKSRLHPLLDFCDHYQKVHLRRGLVIYCGLLLRGLRTVAPADPRQLILYLLSASPRLRASVVKNPTPAEK